MDTWCSNSDHLEYIADIGLLSPSYILFWDVWGFDTVLFVQGGWRSSRFVSGDMLSCWCWRRNKRSWLEPCWFPEIIYSWLYRGQLKGPQMMAMTAERVSKQMLQIQRCRMSNSLNVSFLFVCAEPHCYVSVKYHIWFQTSKLNWHKDWKKTYNWVHTNI